MLGGDGANAEVVMVVVMVVVVAESSVFEGEYLRKKKLRKAVFENGCCGGVGHSATSVNVCVCVYCQASE